MGIPLTLQPPPLFDRSLVPAFQTNFNRIRDALLKAFGGDFQSGVESFTFTANTSVQRTVTFETAFGQTTGPVVIITPIDNLTFPGMHAYVTRATNVSFIAVMDSLGGAVSGTATARWVAWYP